MKQSKGWKVKFILHDSNKDVLTFCHKIADFLSHMQHAEKTINTDYLTNHLYDPEMKQLNIVATNSIQ